MIVTSVTDTHIHWVSFDAENSSGISQRADHMILKTCSCGYYDRYEDHCPTCKGVGEYEQTILGYDRSKILGSNVKAYIISCLTKNFGF